MNQTVDLWNFSVCVSINWALECSISDVVCGNSPLEIGEVFNSVKLNFKSFSNINTNVTFFIVWWIVSGWNSINGKILENVSIGSIIRDNINIIKKSFLSKLRITSQSFQSYQSRNIKDSLICILFNNMSFQSTDLNFSIGGNIITCNCNSSSENRYLRWRCCILRILLYINLSINLCITYIWIIC